ncbi:unnamed protein product [Durusdinium trenchii]|uniref:tRNA/rRNA methyltransferase SpoU type domain-containing protein n=1 Tax=Durusdinium trenchii TaxID=1381693 RepID=A0ABP0K5Z3_9DINO
MDWELPFEEETASETTTVLRRDARLEQSARRRLEGLRVVLEDLCDPGNRAAILRSVEAFGLLHVHEVCHDVATGRRPAQTSTARGRSIVNGAEKWLNLHQHEGVEECIKSLQAAGFGVWAAVPPQQAGGRRLMPLDELCFGGKTALLFGSEARGVSTKAVESCDGCFTVPLFGLSESLVAQSQVLKPRSQRLRVRGGLGALGRPEAPQGLGPAKGHGRHGGAPGGGALAQLC